MISGATRIPVSRRCWRPASQSSQEMGWPLRMEARLTEIKNRFHVVTFKANPLRKRLITTQNAVCQAF